MINEDSVAVQKFRETENEEYLQVLIKKYLRPVYSYCVFMTKDGDISEDITQEVFLKMWKHLKKYNSDKSFKTWLFTIAHHTAIDFLKKRKVNVFSDFDNEEILFSDTLVDTKIPHEEFLIKEGDTQFINTCIDDLPLLYKEIIILKNIEGMTFAEISNTLEQSINTVMSKHRRGLLLLKKMVDARK